MLKNKITIITGASSGIGKACAVKFAEAGAKLIITARRANLLNELKSELENKFETDVYALPFDIRSNEEVESAFNSLPSEWKDFDILINNAGMARGLNKMQDSSIDDWKEMIDTNFSGLLYVTRMVLPIMVNKQSGHIINIGSTAGHDVYPAGNVYCATKFAVKAISQSLRIDLLDKKIKVSSVDPGMVETDFSMVRFSGDEERAKNVYKDLIPLTPEDVAEAVMFCASRPPHVNINEIILTPLAQASSNFVIRNKE